MTAKKTNSNKVSVVPESIDQVPVRGKGGLRKSLLTASLLPLLAVAVLLIIVGSIIYANVIEKDVSSELQDIAEAVEIHFDTVYPGDYTLLIDNGNSETYLQKAGVTISNDTGYIESMAEKTGTDISIFFYDTRMMTTLKDKDGKSMKGTIANTSIVESTIAGRQDSFYDKVYIDGERYCVEYVPVYSANGTCLGMIGVARTYDTISAQVRQLILFNAAAIILAMVFVGVCIAFYVSNLTGALSKLTDFLDDIAQGHLDRDPDINVIKREDEIGDMGRCIQYVRSSLRKLVEKDPLTKLNNRRAGQLKLDQIRAKSARSDNPYSVAMGDIDFFKKVNDTYGHDAGDAVLKEVARILSDAMMGNGTVIRWGGEEFLFVFERMSEEQAAVKLRGILDKIRETTVDHDGQSIKFTMSYGVVTGSVDRASAEDIRLADERLYFAKEHGRNRVVSGVEFEAPAE